MSDTNPLTEQVQAATAWITKLRAEIAKVIVGQEQLVDRLLADEINRAPGASFWRRWKLGHARNESERTAL